MGRPARHLLDDSLHALTIGVHQSRIDRANALSDTRTTEYEQQVHVPLSGAANTGWASVDKKVNWEIPYLYAPVQRRVPFKVPHFTYGVEFENAPAALVIIHVAVLRWTRTEQDWIVGATIRCAVLAPEATAPVPYSAVAHLSFQGWGSAAEQGDQ